MGGTTWRVEWQMLKNVMKCSCDEESVTCKVRGLMVVVTGVISVVGRLKVGEDKMTKKKIEKKSHQTSAKMLKRLSVSDSATRAEMATNKYYIYVVWILVYYTYMFYVSYNMYLYMYG